MKHLTSGAILTAESPQFDTMTVACVTFFVSRYGRSFPDFVRDRFCRPCAAPARQRLGGFQLPLVLTTQQWRCQCSQRRRRRAIDTIQMKPSTVSAKTGSNYQPVETTKQAAELVILEPAAAAGDGFSLPGARHPLEAGRICARRLPATSEANRMAAAYMPERGRHIALGTGNV